jgi:hypothetical protein
MLRIKWPNTQHGALHTDRETGQNLRSYSNPSYISITNDEVTLIN